MKPQDLVFLLSLALLIVLKKPKIFVLAGLFSLVLSAVLFSQRIFFTAERLTWYAAAFFLVSIIIYFIEFRKNR